MEPFPATIHPTGDGWEFHRGDGRRLCGFRHRQVLRPGLHPILAPGGSGVLTRWEPPDHPWHYGVFFGMNDVDGWDFWTPDHPKRPLAVRGRILHRGAEVEHRAIRSRNDWQTSAGLLLAREETIIALGDPGDDQAYAIDLCWEFVPTRDLLIGRYPYGGLAVRLTGDAATVRSLAADGSSDLPARGDLVEARWAAIAAPPDGLPGEMAGIAVLDHPDNPRHPPSWCMDAGCAFLSPCLVAKEPMRLARDQPIRLAYRLVVFRGHPDAVRLDAAWCDWAAGPAIQAASRSRPGAGRDGVASRGRGDSM